MICLQRASDYISISITLWFHSFCYYNSYEIDSIHEWKESFGRSSIHPLNMSNETKASVDVATFQVAQTKKKLSTGHTSIKRNIQIVKAKARRAVAVTTEKRIFCCLCFDLTCCFFLLYAYLYVSSSFLFWTIPFWIHICVRCLYQNFIVVRETTEKLHLEWNETKKWMNEKSSKIIQVAENIKSPRTHVQPHTQESRWKQNSENQ